MLLQSILGTALALSLAAGGVGSMLPQTLEEPLPQLESLGTCPVCQQGELFFHDTFETDWELIGYDGCIHNIGGHKNKIFQRHVYKY